MTLLLLGLHGRRVFGSGGGGGDGQWGRTSCGCGMMYVAGCVCVFVWPAVRSCLFVRRVAPLEYTPDITITYNEWQARKQYLLRRVFVLRLTVLHICTCKGCDRVMAPFLHGILAIFFTNDMIKVSLHNTCLNNIQAASRYRTERAYHLWYIFLLSTRAPRR